MAHPFPKRGQHSLLLLAFLTSWFIRRVENRFIFATSFLLRRWTGGRAGA